MTVAYNVQYSILQKSSVSCLAAPPLRIIVEGVWRQLYQTVEFKLSHFHVLINSKMAAVRGFIDLDMARFKNISRFTFTSLSHYK